MTELTRTSPEQRAELERLANAATPGEWHSTGGDIWIEVAEQVCCQQFRMGDAPWDEPACCGEPQVQGHQEQVGSAGEADAAFIAAANPAHVLSLLGELKAAEDALADSTRSHVATSDQGSAWMIRAETAEAALKAKDAELDALKNAAARRMFPIMRGPAIPWDAIAPFDHQARANHGGQTLEQLARRGGLSACEAVCVMECKPWRKIEDRAAIVRLLELTVAPSPAQPSGENV